MPIKFDKIGINRFEGGVLVGSQNKYPTKISFLDALLESDYNYDNHEGNIYYKYEVEFGKYSLEELLNEIKETFVRGCVCSNLDFEGFHYEITDSPDYLLQRYSIIQRGVFKAWQYGDFY